MRFAFYSDFPFLFFWLVGGIKSNELHVFIVQPFPQAPIPLYFAEHS